MLLFKNILFSSFFQCLILLALCVDASAETRLRGFQVGLIEVDEPYVEALAFDWEVNLVRLQVGDNHRMDFTADQAYLDMMESVFSMLDEKLPWFEKHAIKVVLSLYSPPGGYEIREGAPHHLMFSNRGLQEDYFSMLQQIAARYGDHPAVYALDILNEPAIRKDKLCANCLSWPDVVPRAVEAIRKAHPSLNIMVKSVYGDPTALRHLPAINDPHVIYSYHAYLFRPYQSAGLEHYPRDKRRPPTSRINRKVLRLTGKFVKKLKKLARQGLYHHYPPRLNVGEFAMSNCSNSEPEEFLSDLISVLEQDRKIKRLSRTPKIDALREKRRRRYEKDIVHESWTNHAFLDDPVWDPRYICTEDGLLEYRGHTERGNLMRRFFSRNS